MDERKELLNQVKEVLETEIKWCVKNPDKRLSLNYRDGFKKGLKQAKKLIRSIK